MHDDEVQRLLGRIIATLENQDEVLERQDKVLDEVRTLARDNATQIEVVKTQVDEHKKLDVEVAGKISDALAPVVKHVTVWNGVTKTILFVAGVGGGVIAFGATLYSGVKHLLKIFWKDGP